MSNRVHIKGREVVIMEQGRPAAKLVPRVTRAARARRILRRSAVGCRFSILRYRPPSSRTVPIAS